MVFRHALEHQPQPRRSLLDRQGTAGKILEQPRGTPLRRWGVGQFDVVRLARRTVHEMLEKIPHTTAEDATQRRRREQLLREEARAIAFDELPDRGK